MYGTGEIVYCGNRAGNSIIRIELPGLELIKMIKEKSVSMCTVWIDDGRSITAEQRKKAYAMIADIAEYTGEVPEVTKEWLKYLHISRTGCSYFSLSDCSMDTARQFINTMLDLALEWGIPLAEGGVYRTDDIHRYLYSCLKNRRCAVCGRSGEIHHVDAVGMGRNRQTIDDSAMKKICLCRRHHEACHRSGDMDFLKRYHVYGIYYDERREDIETD